MPCLWRIGAGPSGSIWQCGSRPPQTVTTSGSAGSNLPLLEALVSWACSAPGFYVVKIEVLFRQVFKSFKSSNIE